MSVEIGTEHFQALATVAVEPERTELYEQMAETYSIFTEYLNKTTRIIPVIILTHNR